MDAGFLLLRTLLHVTVSLIFFGHRVLWRDPSSINPFCQKDHRRFHYLLQQLGRLPRFHPAGCCRDCDRVQRRPKHLTNSPNSWRVIVRTNNISRVAHRVHKYAAKMLKNIDDLTRIRTPNLFWDSNAMYLVTLRSRVRSPKYVCTFYHWGKTFLPFRETFYHWGKTFTIEGKLLPLSENISHIGKTIYHYGKTIYHWGKTFTIEGKLFTVNENRFY